MHVQQHVWSTGAWRDTPPMPDARPPIGEGAARSLVLVFASGTALEAPALLEALAAARPGALLAGCSTAGEIAGTGVLDDTAVVTILDFERTTLRTTATAVDGAPDSRAAGARLAAALDPAGLVHVLVLTDGIHVNGSELVAGLAGSLPPSVSITGGLSADGPRFEETRVLVDGAFRSRVACAVGLYGDAVRVGYASLGGWDPFGPERIITRSTGNVLFELDGQPALDLYMRYLGEHAAGLPGTGLLFPLSVRVADGDTPVVRTILGIDEAARSLTFAGDVPAGAFARLMRANVDRLVDGASDAASTSREPIGDLDPSFALLVSCVGRRMVLRQRVEEEVEAVRSVLGEDVVLAGFYSYGEISPFTPSAKCELHNQTMTITALGERAA